MCSKALEPLSKAWHSFRALAQLAWWLSQLVVTHDNHLTLYTDHEVCELSLGSRSRSIRAE